MQWSRNVATMDGEEPEDSADVESCGSNEASTVSGENDGKCNNKSQEETGRAKGLSCDLLVF